MKQEINYYEELGIEEAVALCEFYSEELSEEFYKELRKGYDKYLYSVQKGSCPYKAGQIILNAIDKFIRDRSSQEEIILLECKDIVEESIKTNIKDLVKKMSLSQYEMEEIREELYATIYEVGGHSLQEAREDVSMSLKVTRGLLESTSISSYDRRKKKLAMSYVKEIW